MDSSTRPMVLMSRTSGTLRSTSGSWVRRAAHRSGSEAFLAPEMRTVPSRGRPPTMRIFSMTRVYRVRQEKVRGGRSLPSRNEDGLNVLLTGAGAERVDETVAGKLVVARLEHVVGALGQCALERAQG